MKEGVPPLPKERCTERAPSHIASSRAKTSGVTAKEPVQGRPGSIVCEHSRSKCLTYSKWCATLLRNVLKTRTPFSSFVARNLSLPRVSSTAPSYFPMPIPPGDWFKRMKPDISLSKRRRIHENRALTVIVLALSYWYNGGPVKSELLAKAPNALHFAFYRRLADLGAILGRRAQ